MSDIKRTTGPDRKGLFQLATGQHGYFMASQAGTHGYSRPLLAHHARSGTFRRVRTGLYRFRDYPSSPVEEVVAAWLAVGQDLAVVSHQSALGLWELSDIIADAVHLTVPRTRRNLPKLPGVVIHTTTRPLHRTDLRERDGIRVTSPARTLLDCAEAGVGPDQVEMAVRQAEARGWIDAEDLRTRAAKRNLRVARLIGRALERAKEVSAK